MSEKEFDEMIEENKSGDYAQIISEIFKKTYIT